MLFHRKGNTKYHNNKILDNFSSRVLCPFDNIEPCWKKYVPLFYFRSVDVVGIAVLADAEHTVLKGLLRLRFKQQRIDTHGRTV